MALRVQYTKRFQGVHWKSGHFYKFRYQAWQNDPEPTILLMYAYTGTHPTTGRQWRFFQGINFTYIPRTQRRHFMKRWMAEWESTNGQFQLTWDRIIAEFPFLKTAVRRYFYSPSYYIQKPIELPMEDMEEIVVSTWAKDFSKNVRTNVRQKFRKARSRFFGR